MALKGSPITVGTAQTTLVTMPSNKEGAVHGLQIGNTTGSNINISFTYTDSSASADVSFLTTTVSGNSTFTFSKPINLNGNDAIKASASQSGLVAIASVFEDTTVNVASLSAAGEYTATVTYNFGDLVTDGNGNTFLSTFDGNVNRGIGNSSAFQTFASKGDTGSISANPTLVNPVLSGDFTTSSGNFDIDPATQIVEIKGNGSDTEGQIQLNCHANSHGQIIKAQPHSEGVTNTSLLPKGASSTLVSEAGTATLTNKTFDVVNDADGNLRDIPLSTKVSGNYTLAIGDVGNQVTINSANVTVTVPTGVFAVGDIVSLVSVNGCTATLACTAVNAVKAGDLAATALHTLDANGVASIMFSYTADLAVLTGNIS